MYMQIKGRLHKLLKQNQVKTQIRDQNPSFIKILIKTETILFLARDIYFLICTFYNYYMCSTLLLLCRAIRILITSSVWFVLLWLVDFFIGFFSTYCTKYVYVFSKSTRTYSICICTGIALPLWALYWKSSEVIEHLPSATTSPPCIIYHISIQKGLCLP